jgi:hypothetical protein
MAGNSTLSWKPMPSEEELPDGDRQRDSGLGAYYRLTASGPPLERGFDGLTPLEHQIFDPFLSFFPPVMFIMLVAYYLPAFFRTVLTLFKYVVG